MVFQLNIDLIMKNKFLNALVFCVIYLMGTSTLLAQPKFPSKFDGDTHGFIPIFDGETLDGWEGDLNYWRVEDGQIIGEVTADKLLKQNSFLIWREGTAGDFELKLEYKVSAEGNSGINYRSYEFKNNPYALKGYQCDIDGKGRWTGQNYEEKGRKFLALRGQVTEVNNENGAFEIGTVGKRDALLQYINQEDWNACHIIVRGNIMIHKINGHVMSIVVDNDVENRKMDGLLGVQVHVGPPMTISYKNIRIKKF